MADQDFKFPDETVIDTSGKAEATEKEVPVEEEKLEIEVVDDTPPEDKGRPPMKEPPPDVTDEELEQYSSEAVKKRLKHFSKGYHEERRAKEAALKEREEAIRYAQQVIEENKRLQANLGKGQEALLEQAKKAIANEVEIAKRAYKEAYEAGDADRLVEAQEALAKAAARAERVNNIRPPALQAEKTEVQPVPQPQERQQPVSQVDSKARAWKESNPWFGSDDEMTAVALAVHKKLVDRGVDTTSDEYYEGINSRMKQLFPDAFSDAEPPVKKTQPAKNVVAPATRSTAPKKVTLTERQVTIAKRLGVPLEAYARQVAEEMRKQNG